VTAGKSSKTNAARSPSPDELPLSGILDRNIQALIHLRKDNDQVRGWHERVVYSLAAFIGSLRFIYLHFAVLIGLFVLAWWASAASIIHGEVMPIVEKFPLTSLAGLASIEAIFLSTLVLINQRRTNELVERREDLDLQVSLITEHEITRLLHVCDMIAKHLNLNTDSMISDLAEANQDLSPEMVLNRIEAVKSETEGTLRD
jgi:uncharacterized membrane protein